LLLGIFVDDATIRTEAVLEAVKLPAGVSDLNTGLTDRDRDNFTHSVEV